MLRRKGLSRQSSPRIERGGRYVYVTEDLQAILDAAHRRGWRCVGDLVEPKFRRTMRFRCLPDWQRFALSYVQAEGGCWEWVGSKKPSGYGQFHFRDTNWQAHRVAYELYVGSIPDGMTIDHLCRNRGCVNPEHLEPVPGATNTARGISSRTHCRKGHELTAATRLRRAFCKVCHDENVEKSSDVRRARAYLAGTSTPRATGPAPAVRRLVARRSGRTCEFRDCGATAIHLHHRKPRRMGGSRDPKINGCANLAHVCLYHHEWVESNRADAGGSGWLLSDSEDPAEVAILTGHGWVLLDNDGGYEVLPEVEW